jgi:hypothetical protein
VTVARAKVFSAGCGGMSMICLPMRIVLLFCTMRGFWNEQTYSGLVPAGHRCHAAVLSKGKQLGQAKKRLEAEYGKGNVLDLHSEEDADRPR